MVSGNGGSGCPVVRPTESTLISGTVGYGHGTCHEYGPPC